MVAFGLNLPFYVDTEFLISRIFFFGGGGRGSKQLGVATFGRKY